jgi:hypothetical protein
MGVGCVGVGWGGVGCVGVGVGWGGCVCANKLFDNSPIDSAAATIKIDLFMFSYITLMFTISTLINALICNLFSCT